MEQELLDLTRQTAICSTQIASLKEDLTELKTDVKSIKYTLEKQKDLKLGRFGKISFFIFTAIISGGISLLVALLS